MKKMILTFLSAGLAATLFLASCSTDGGSGAASSESESDTQVETEQTTVTGAGSYVVATMEQLLELEPKETKAIVVLKGYHSSGDGGGGTFYYDATARMQDNGATVIKGNKAKGRFVRDCEENYVNVKWFGARGNGTADDTAAIQAAIDALPNGGGTVVLPGGTYNISSTLNIGDGDAGQKVSSKGGIKLIGTGGGFAFSTPASTSIMATAEMDAMIHLRGRISDCEIAGVYLNGNNKAKTCLYLHSFTGGYFHNIMAIGFTDIGIKVMAGTAPTGNYNIYNRFESIGVFCLYDNTTAILFDGDYGNNNDTWLSVITDCRFDTAQSKNSIAAHFKFVDSISFYRCHFNTYDNSSIGAVFDALNNHDFPCGMAFYDCSMVSHEVWEDSTHSIRKQYFYGFGTYDNEKIPTHNKLIGVTDTGETFNMDDLDVFLANKNNGSANGGTEGGTDSTEPLDEYFLLAKGGRVDTFSGGQETAKHRNLLQEQAKEVAVLVNAKGNLIGGSFYLSSYDNNVGTVKFDVYRWDTDYETTLKGEVLATDSVVDFQDNTMCDVEFEGLGSGYYLIVATGSAPAGDFGVAVWTRSAVSTSITFVNGERVDAGLHGQFITN